MRWKQRPPGSNWGDFGSDDERGRMNWVDASKVMEGIAEVREGRTFCLSLPLDFPGGNTLNPRRNPPRRYATVRDGASAGAQNFCWSYASEDVTHSDVVCDDLVVMTMQYSTQWDSFAHMGSRFDADGDGVDEAVFYNGFRAGQHIRAGHEDTQAPAALRYPDPVAEKLGMQVLAEHGAQGRGVMIDLAAHHPLARKAIGYDDLMQIVDTDRIEITRGDMVCLHTGFGELLLGMRRQPDARALHAQTIGLDGRDEKLLQWITDSELACLVADNPAVELTGVTLTDGRLRGPRLPLHEHCLFKNGIHLGELWYLTALARWLREHRRTRFLLTAPPLRLPGVTGSPATPVATV